MEASWWERLTKGEAGSCSDFHSACPLMDKDRDLWKLPDGRDWLRVKLGLVLMFGAVLSKALIQFLLLGGILFFPFCLIWGQSMVEVMKITVTSFEMSHAGFHARTAAPNSLNPAAGHHRPTPLPETPGHSQEVWVSLLWGHCSFLLGSGAHKLLFVPPRVCFPRAV